MIFPKKRSLLIKVCPLKILLFIWLNLFPAYGKYTLLEKETPERLPYFIKYLRTLGYDVTNDIFAENAWYFRNALVRANYNDLKNDIHATTEYLELFLRNLLLGEDNILSNRSMHISHKLDKKVDIQTSEVDIDAKK